MQAQPFSYRLENFFNGGHHLGEDSARLMHERALPAVCADGEERPCSADAEQKSWYAELRLREPISTHVSSSAPSEHHR